MPVPGRSHDTAGLAVTYAGIGAAERRYGEDLIFYNGSGAPYSPGETIIEADLSRPAHAVVQGAARSAVRHQPRRRHPDRAERQRR